MAITTVFFDLDGTLLPMDQEVFIKDYLHRLSAAMAPHGYEPKTLVDAIWRATDAVIADSGPRRNEEVFWDAFAALLGQGVRAAEPLLEAFYREEFPKVSAVCGHTPAAREVVDLLHSRGKGVVLATNPIFPAVATEHRIRWAGLTPEDFLLYTTYENSSRCKPDPAYYEEICRVLNLSPRECLMVGNDAEEDMVAEKTGMEVFLLTDCLINAKNRDITPYRQGGFGALKAYLETI